MDPLYSVHYALKLGGGNYVSFTVPATVGTGIWDWLITPGQHRIGLRYIFDNNNTNVADLFIDGVLQTPTVVVAPENQSAHVSHRLIIGGDRGGYTSSQDWLANSFSGRVGEIAICSQLHSDALMARYTSPA